MRGINRFDVMINFINDFFPKVLRQNVLDIK